MNLGFERTHTDSGRSKVKTERYPDNEPLCSIFSTTSLTGCWFIEGVKSGYIKYYALIFKQRFIVLRITGTSY